MQAEGHARRQLWFALTLALVVVPVLLWGALAGDAGEELWDACQLLVPGDPLAAVVLTLGTDGYRPGCGQELPCQTFQASKDVSIRYACDGDDCDLLWRVDVVQCYVSMGPDLVVREAEARRLPGVDGPD
jgi:hypothetical protein